MKLTNYIMTPAEFAENFLRYCFPAMCVISVVINTYRHYYFGSIGFIIMIVFNWFIVKKMDEMKKTHEMMVNEDR